MDDIRKTQEIYEDFQFLVEYTKVMQTGRSAELIKLKIKNVKFSTGFSTLFAEKWITLYLSYR